MRFLTGMPPNILQPHIRVVFESGTTFDIANQQQAPSLLAVWPLSCDRRTQIQYQTGALVYDPWSTILLQRQQLHTASLFVIYHLCKFRATSDVGNAGMQYHQWTNGLNPASCASTRIYTYSTTRSTSTQPSVVVELSHLAKRAVAGPQRRAQFSQAIESQHTALTAT